MSNLKRKMKSLGRPYKKSTAYKKYGEPNGERPKSTFWSPKVRFVVKYETTRI